MELGAAAWAANPLGEAIKLKTKLILLALLATAAWSQCAVPAIGAGADPRVWIGTYAPGTTYALCNVVYDAVDAKAYVSIQAVNAGHQPDTSNTWWTLLHSAPVNLQSGDSTKGAHIALDYNLAWLRANGTGGAATNGSTGQVLKSNGAGGFGTPGLVSGDIPPNAANTSGTAAGLSGLPANASLFYNGNGVFSAPPGGGSMVYPSAGIPISTGSAWGTSVTLPADPTKFYNGNGAFSVPVSGAAPPIFSALHAGFTAYNNPASSITGTVSYTDYSGQSATIYRGPGIATVTEPVSMNRAMVSITSAFQAAIGAPSISGLQVSLGTATNSTAYMNPIQVGYSLTTVAPLTTCTASQPTFVVASPVALANQNTTLVVSGVSPAAYNGTYTGTWTTSTTFVTTSPAITCAAYTISSNGMAGLQGLIYGNFTALPQGMSGTNTAYLYLTETNTNPAPFLGNLLAGSVKVMLEGVQVQ